MRFAWATSWLLLLGLQVSAQSDDLYVEDLAPQTAIEDLDQIENQTNSFNKMEAADLEQLQIFSEDEILCILDHRNKFGPFLDFLELQLCGIPASRIRILKDHVVITSEVSRASSKLHSETIFTVAHRAQKLEEDEPSAGSKFVWRQRMRYGSLAAVNMTFEQDPGEAFMHKQGIPLFDFQSISMEVRKGKAKAVVGDFTMSAGQGLIYGQGFVQGKTSHVMQISLAGKGLRPYRSLDENRFFRGVGAEYQLGKLNVKAFYSYNKVDARVSGDSLLTLQYSGLHRTESELAWRKQVRLTSSGASAAYKFGNHLIGLNALINVSDKRFIVDTNSYKRFNPTGRRHSTVGIYHAFEFNTFRLFGEMVGQENKSHAFILGLQKSMGKSTDVSVLFRDYSKGFFSLHGRGFGASSNSTNERGLYCAVKHTWAGLSLQTYLDYFVFPWLKYGNLSAADGTDLLVQLNYQPTKKRMVYVRWQLRETEIFTFNDGVRQLISESRTSWRLHVEEALSSRWALRCRYEFHSVQRGKVKAGLGQLTYLDFKWSAPQRPVSLSWRITLANIGGSEARIYAFERDVPLSYSIPSYGNNTAAAYALLRFKLTKSADFWLKFSALREFEKVERIKSGLYIAGQSAYQLKFQIALRFHDH